MGCHGARVLGGLMKDLRIGGSGKWINEDIFNPASTRNVVERWNNSAPVQFREIEMLTGETIRTFQRSKISDNAFMEVTRLVYRPLNKKEVIEMKYSITAKDPNSTRVIVTNKVKLIPKKDILSMKRINITIDDTIEDNEIN